MRMTRGWTGLRTAVIALGIIAWTTTGAKADPLLTYSTVVPVGQGVVGGDTVTGTNVISLVPATNFSVDPTSYVSLGSFQVAAPPTGTTTTYNATPFSLTFLPATYNGVAISDTTPPVISGTLTGTVTGQQSTVVATFNPTATGSFELGSTSSSVSIPFSQLPLVPASDGGTTTIEGLITPGAPGAEQGVPEPSTIALFLSTIGGLGLRRFVLNRRQRSQA
jgi:hypothetical protein